MATATTDSKVKVLREAAQKILALDHFAALGVSRTATPEQVKQAFIEVVRNWHPDRVPQGLEEVKPLFAKVFARFELARSTVNDPTRRARYIEELSKPPASATSDDLSSAEAALEFRKAEAMLKKNDAKQAGSHLRRAIQLAPQHADYVTLHAWLQAKPDITVERLRELVSELDRVIARDVNHERAHFYRAQLRRRLQLPKEAAADFARAAELNPKNVDAMREVRIHKMRQGNAATEAVRATEAGSGIGGFFRKLFKR